MDQYVQQRVYKVVHFFFVDFITGVVEPVVHVHADRTVQGLQQQTQGKWIDIDVYFTPAFASVSSVNSDPDSLSPS